MKVLKIFTLLFIVLFITCFGFFKKDAIACELVGISHFTEISPNVFIDNSIDSFQQSSLSNSIQAAIARVSDIYGTPISNPRIIATAKTTYAKYGFNLTGMQSSGFFRECIFLGPKGLNTDVVAHELVHAELRHRTSLYVELIKLPAWFIEGTAIKADHREPFLLHNIILTTNDIARVRSVFYLSDFPNSNVKYYQASLIAVEPMNSKSMYAGLEKLNNGAQFKDVFPELF